MGENPQIWALQSCVEWRFAVSDGDVCAAHRGVLANDVGDAKLVAGSHACASRNEAIVSSTEGSSVM